MRTCVDLLTLQAKRALLVPGSCHAHEGSLHPGIHAWQGRDGLPARMRKVFLQSYLKSFKEPSTPERLDGANGNFTGCSPGELSSSPPLEELD